VTVDSCALEIVLLTYLLVGIFSKIDCVVLQFKKFAKIHPLRFHFEIEPGEKQTDYTQRKNITRNFTTFCYAEVLNDILIFYE